MRQRRRFSPGWGVLLSAALLGIPVIATAADADSVPESLRIQEKAEKAYEASPVVPIERGNAHHRDLQKDDQGGGEDLLMTPPPSEPPAKDRSNDKQ